MQPYVSIDLETTGLDDKWCQILELGAVVDVDGKTDVDKLPCFHTYVLHDHVFGEPYALAMNAEILRRIAKKESPWTYYEPVEAIQRLRDFLSIHFGDNKIIAAGKNFASFDLQFLKNLDIQFDRDKCIKFHHRSIDPSMLWWDIDKDKEPPGSKLCMERAGIEGEVAHTAVEDAQMVIKLIRNAKRYLRS